MKTRLNVSKDTVLMSALLVTGMLMTALAPAMYDTDASASQQVVDNATGVAQTAIAPAAMRPVLMQPAIIVTAPRVVPAIHTAKSRRASATAA